MDQLDNYSNVPILHNFFELEVISILLELGHFDKLHFYEALNIFINGVSEILWKRFFD